MPTEIRKDPENFAKKIPCLRADIEEIITFLESTGVVAEAVIAISNDAQFEGLDDIRSAPSRFSGEPFVQVAKKSGGEIEAFANIDFKKKYTVVSGGKHRGYNAYNEENYELAKRIYEELRPFSNQLEHWAGRILGAFTFLGGLLILVLLVLTGLDIDKLADTTFYGIPVPDNAFFVFSMIWFAALFTDFSFKRRIPVRFNPRTTFWQKHGEAAVVGVCGSLLTAFVFWFFTKS